MSKRTLKKAYRDERFLMSRAARPIRILAEYLEPEARHKKYRIKDTVVFFGSARVVSEEKAEELFRKAKTHEEKKRAKWLKKFSFYYEKARELSRLLTEYSIKEGGGKQKFYIATGGGPGIMEAANRGAKEAGGESIGYNISIPIEQDVNPFVTERLSFEFHYFFMRKFWFLYLAKAAVVFPGGFGTLDELFEILTLVQTKKLKKRLLIVLFGKEYWEKLIDFQLLYEYGLIDQDDLKIFKIFDSIEDIFKFLKKEL